MTKTARLKHWLHDLLRHKQLGWIIQLGIAGCVAMLIWMLTGTAVPPTPTFNEYLEHEPAVGNVSLREHCPECGVVSSTRRIQQAAEGLNPGIEVTVRMRDGSRRQFMDASSANWRVGERLIIIGSANHAGE